MDVRVLVLSRMTDPALMKLAVGSGVGALILDCEHGFPWGEDVTRSAEACHAAGGRCLVRLNRHQWNGAGPLCDGGIDGIIASNVRNLGELTVLAGEMLPAPDGQRSVNPFAPCTPILGNVGSFEATARTLELWAMAETEEFVEVAATLSVTSLPAALKTLWRGVFIGPYDLSAAMGVECSPTNGKLVETVLRLATDCKAAGLEVGIFSRDRATFDAWLDTGLVPDRAIVGYDRDIWASACRERVEAFEGRLTRRAPSGVG